MRRLKIIVVSFALFCFTSPAFALAPLVLPIVYSAILHTAVVVAGVYYYMRPSGPRNVSPNGTISRGAAVTYVDLTGDIPVVVEKNLTTSMTMQQAENIVRSHKNDYPALRTKLLAPAEYNGIDYTQETWTAGTGQLPFVGAIMHIPSGGDALYYCGYVSGTWSKNGAEGWYDDGHTYCNTTTCIGGLVSFTNVANFLLPPLTSAEVQGLTGSSSGGEVQSAYQAEIDKMFQDPSYVPSFSDDTTGLPYYPPPQSNVMTPAQIDSYNANIAADSAKQTSLDSASAATQSANNYANNAANRYVSSGGNINNGSGGDPALYQDYLKAKADLDAAKAREDALKNQYANQDAQKAEETAVAPPVPGDNGYDSGITAPDSKNLTSLLTGFFNSSPLAAIVRSFTINTSEASPIVNLGTIYGTQLSIDFTRYQSTINLAGTILLVAAHGFAILVIMKGWR